MKPAAKVQGALRSETVWFGAIVSSTGICMAITSNGELVSTPTFGITLAVIGVIVVGLRLRTTEGVVAKAGPRAGKAVKCP